EAGGEARAHGEPLLAVAHVPNADGGQRRVGAADGDYRLAVGREGEVGDRLPVAEADGPEAYGGVGRQRVAEPVGLCGGFGGGRRFGRDQRRQHEETGHGGRGGSRRGHGRSLLERGPGERGPTPSSLIARGRRVQWEPAGRYTGRGRRPARRPPAVKFTIKNG